MAAPRIPPDASLAQLLDENSFTLGELPSHSLAAPFTPEFDAFQTSWFTTFTARAALQIAVGKAEGTIAGADNNLDDFIDILDRTLLILTKNDRTALLYRFYFGIKTVSEQKRPILSEELTTVKGWVGSLQSSPHASLVALAAPLIALIDSAVDAVDKHQKAVQALRDFDMLGGKKELIDACNALRQRVYGKLAAMPHEHPTAALPATFADRFFRHGSKKGITEIKNPDRVQAKITALQKKLTVAQNHLTNLQEEAKAQEAAEATKRNDETALAEAKAKEEAATQARKALEKQLKTDKRKTRKT